MRAAAGPPPRLTSTHPVHRRQGIAGSPPRPETPMDISTQHHRSITSRAPDDRGRAAHRRAGHAARARPGDRVFLGLSRGSGIPLLVIMAAIAVFLTYRAVPRHHPRTTATSSPPSSGTPGRPAGLRHRASSPSARSSARSSRWSSRSRSRSASRCSSRTTRRASSRRRIAYVIDLLAAVPSHHLRPLGRPVPRPAPDGLDPLARRVPRLDRRSSTWPTGSPARSHASPSASCWRS